jgi:isopenicillin-N N-acyltransferase-like protein
MKKEFKPFPLYEFAGTEREIGRQMGEELRDECKGTISYWYDVLGLMFPDSLESMIETCKKFEAPAKEYAPELWEQIEGIAEGANMTTDEVLFIQGGWEIDSCGPQAFGCTDFACSGQATKGGKTIVGQNFDWYPNAPTIVVRVKPKGKPSYLAVTWPGHLAQVGISESGFGMFINLLITADNGRVGVPYSFITNKILYQKNVPDALRAVTQGNPASSFDYTIAGKDGEILNVEVAANTNGYKCGIVLPDKDILAHSNHYLTPYLRYDCQNDQTSFPDSWLREYRMRQLMEAKRGDLDVAAMMEILQDHRGYPDSICRHCDMTGPVFEQFETVFSCIATPEDGKLWSTPNPCQNPYTLYTL